jgi:hypothetical protein
MSETIRSVGMASTWLLAPLQNKQQESMEKYTTLSAEHEESNTNMQEPPVFTEWINEACK